MIKVISLRRFLQTKLNRKRAALLSILILVIVVSSGVFVYKSHKNEQAQKTEAARQLGEQQELASVTAEEQESAADAAKAAAEQNAETATPDQTVVKGEAVVKYSTSSDPRSTAYSTTPPKPNPTDVNIKITRPNQLAAGSLLYNNSAKGEKGYYGGDLIVTPSFMTVVYDQTQNIFTVPQKFQIQTPDGQTVLPPSFPWDWNFNNSPVSFGTIGSSGPPPGASFTFDLTPIPTLTREGTFTLQFHTVRATQTADSWSYDGFLTVKVTYLSTMVYPPSP